MKLYTKLLLLGVFALPSSMMAEDMMCTMEYAPVCGKVNVQCIKAPCEPVYETFSNKCVMQQNKLAEYAYDGECKAGTGNQTSEPDALDNYFLQRKMTNDLKKIQVLTQLEYMINDLRIRSLMTPEQSQKVDRVLNLVSEKNLSLKETYITNNIGKLSVVKPVLGGNWYVTDIAWSGNTAKVNYEDGHIAENLNISFTNSLYPTITVPAYIQSISGNKINFDPIQLFMGEEANNEAVKDKADVNGEAQGGYYIRNNDKATTTISLNNPNVIMQTYSMKGTSLNLNQQIKLSEFIKYFKGLSKTYSNIPFHISIQNGKVTNILEQLLP